MSGILQAFAYGRAFTSAPVNTVAPAITGTAQARQTLTCSTGTWTGIPTPTYTYQWQYGVSNTPISGATSSTYVVAGTYVGQTIRCVVTATNSIAAVSANSNSTSAVTANTPAAPTIGTATASGTTGATVTYTAPSDNGGATITAYTATSSPGGITGTLSTSGSGTITVSGLTTGTAYTFTVTATNSVGTSAASAASNSITPVAVGFLASAVYSGTTYNQSRYVAVNSSGTIYTALYSAYASPNNFLLSYTSTGTANFIRNGYVGNFLEAVGVDSSNNYYALGRYASTGAFQISKLNSSDTLQWSTSFVINSAGEAVVAFNRPVIDSSGNVYLGYRAESQAGCCFNYAYYMTKLNSSGTIQYTYTYSANGSPYGQAVGTGVDSSGNVYNMLGAVSGGYGALAFYKQDSSGALLLRKFLTESPSGGVTAGDYVFDTANSVGYWVGDVGTGAVVKHDTNLASTWCYSFTDVSEFQGVALDSSGNIYAVGQQYIGAGNGPLRIIKLNSSGTLQWARTLSISGFVFDSYEGKPKISVSGSKFTIVACATNGNYVMATFSAPTDGSGTGTIVNSGLSWVYSTFATSATSKTISAITDGSISARTFTGTSRTPTISNTTLWTNTITTF